MVPPPPAATGAACREAQDALLLDAAGDARDATGRARIERHVEHCAACQAMQRSLGTLAADVRAAGQPLDDVRRARLLAQLAPALDDQAARAAAVTRGDPRWTRALARAWPAGALAVAAAALVAVQSIDRHHPPPPAPAAPVVAAAPAPAPRLPGAALSPPAVSSPATPLPPAAPPALIAPYQVVSGRGLRARLIDQHFSRLQTAAGTTVRARVGPRTRVTLVGPADFSVATATSDVLDVNLAAGTMVADFIHQRNGRLRIHSPGAVTEVVGTLFSVEVRGQRSRVSVARGRVVVQPAEGA
ncbi:MAG TPA: FecR domain-containing protein, partial [Polyangia bacterium]|nr:FecR domain-containing protein [Polyangia bacterium]